MGFHDRMRNMVIRQLALQPKGKGVPITFTRKSGGGYDPMTGEVSPIVTETLVGSGIRVNYKDINYANTTIQHGDFQIYLSPVQDTGDEMPKPAVGDVFTFLEDTARVVSIEPFNDNSVGCGWKLQVRRG
jgi:hypothetical protein